MSSNKFANDIKFRIPLSLDHDLVSCSANHILVKNVRNDMSLIFFGPNFEKMRMDKPGQTFLLRNPKRWPDVICKGFKETAL
jgi:hypothetical protein